MTLIQTITWLQSQIATLAGVSRAPTFPTDGSFAGVFAVCYPAEGRSENAPTAGGRNIENINLELHTSNANLADASRIAMELHPQVLDILNSSTAATMNGNATALVYPITWNFGRMEWAGQQTLGYRYKITLKFLGE